MTAKQGIEQMNHFWPLISAVGTCFLIVIGGVYASGVNVEKIRADQRESNGKVAAVQGAVAEDSKRIDSLSEKIQQVREEISALKAQQRADAEWIKTALLRIEAKQ